MPYLRQVIYVSQVVGPYGKAEERRLLQVAQRNNRRLDVTGVLACSGAHFFQLLEGRSNVLDALIHRLPTDTRHLAIRMLQDDAIATRRYGRWSMAYVYSLDLAEQLLRLWDASADATAGVEAVLARLGSDPEWELL